MRAATRFVREVNLVLQDLNSPEARFILDRAEERLREAILTTTVSRRPKNEDADVEIASYPIAVIVAAATGSSFIKKRYALAEAKQTEADLRDEEFEPKEKLLAVARDFGWKIEANENPAIPFEFGVHFVDYLRNIKYLQGEEEWKLVNRLLIGGKVFLTRGDTAKLLGEEVRNRIEKRLETKDMPALPAPIIELADRIKEYSRKEIGETEMEGFPKTVVQEAFPPCITALYQAFSSGRHLSHVGRFTLTSFLVAVGMPSSKVVELFRGFSDYNEQLTRYQVEHIAGERGSRTHYVPPKCETLKTHNVCTNPDQTCQRTRHPLGYYRRKLRNTKTRP